MAAHSFGDFPSISAFLASFEADRQARNDDAEEGLSLAARRERRRRQQQERNVVEVSGTIRVREPDDVDGDRHHRLRVTMCDVLVSDPDVDTDLSAHLASGEDVFVAIRFGDRMGILHPVPGLDAGRVVHLRGEWIPAAVAREHGGEHLSVLHFTHHPIGFVCTETPEQCFS